MSSDGGDWLLIIDGQDCLSLSPAGFSCASPPSQRVAGYLRRALSLPRGRTCLQLRQGKLILNIPKWNAKGCDDEVAGDEDEERRGVRVELESFKKQLRASNFRRLLLPLQTPFFFPNPYFSRAHFHRHRRSRCLPLGLCLALPPLTAVSSISGGGRFRPLSSIQRAKSDSSPLFATEFFDPR